MQYGLIFVITTSLLVSSVHSYELGQNAENNLYNPVLNVDELFSYSWEPNHEKLTALALQCLADLNQDEPELNIWPQKCDRRTYNNTELSFYNLSKQQRTQAGTVNHYPNILESYRPMIKAVRWPDDPTRQVHHEAKANIKFAATMEKHCKKVIQKFGSIDMYGNGMLCASHFGKLQFLHAMLPAGLVADEGQQVDKNKTLITQWAEFAYQVASVRFNSKQAFLEQKYCDYFKDTAIQQKYPNLINALDLPSVTAKGWCHDRPIKWQHYWDLTLWGESAYPAYTVSSLFSFSCSHWYGSGTCYIVKDADEVTLAALGSILHLIQDSFSKSHTNRGQSDNNAEIICQPVQEFYDYALQQNDTIEHSSADKWPLFHNSCDTTYAAQGKVTLDPITATAQLIWLHANKIEDLSRVKNVIVGVMGI